MKSFNDMSQRCLPLLMEVPKPRYLADELIDAIADNAHAVRVCLEYRVRRIPEGELAECLGLKKAHFSRVKQGTHHLTREQQIFLQFLCSNYAIDQFAERCTTAIYEATETPAETIARLRNEVQQARRSA